MTHPQKMLKDRYLVVPRTLILLFDDGKVLLQKGSPTKKIWAGYYNGLGGHIERGEDVLSAARRELFEESGLTCTDLHLCGVVTIDVEESQGILMFVVSGKIPSGHLINSAEGELNWVDKTEVAHVNCVEDLPYLIGKIETGNFFSLQYLYEDSGKLRIVDGSGRYNGF